MKDSGEEPYALIAHVRICEGRRHNCWAYSRVRGLSYSTGGHGEKMKIAYEQRRVTASPGVNPNSLKVNFLV